MLPKDRAPSPKKAAELLRIELLRKSLSTRTGGEVLLVAIPDEDETDQQYRPCDAILEGEETRFAVELTTIDSYVGQRSDDVRFRRVMGAMEERIGTIPDWTEVMIDVGAIPTGYDWGELSLRIQECLLPRLQELPYETLVHLDIPGIPFSVCVRRERLGGQGGIVVMRRAPFNLEQQRAAVIKNALEDKQSVLGHYKREGFTTVLLLERYDIALANRHVICDTFKKVSPLELCAGAIDDVYLIETPTRPWAISPMKIGPQICDAPSPEWPDAPGYPFLNS